MINPKTPFIYFGGDYNPDQWDSKTIEEDMRLFKKLNVNLVTLPVFSWARLEPSEGNYQFDWLDDVLEKLWKNHIHVCLATPTTAQPAWMSKKYPEILPVDIKGRKRTHGMRVFFCYNSEKYRELAGKITRQMAERYKNFDGLAAWHVCNEYGTHCYCDNCQNKFREWLKKRYGTVEELNKRWSLAFWGRLVSSFDEVMLPTELNDDYRFNPPIALDYNRFLTDSTLECFLNEHDILKSITPDIPVMTNISGHIENLDQFKMVSHMDCAGWDNYPNPDHDKSIIAFKHDLMRGLKGGQSYMMTEQSPNQQNWQPYNKLKKPGEVRMKSYQALAHGADSVLYFQMRQSVGGQEKLHGALISHSGREDTRVFRESEKLGAELKKLGDSFLGGRTHSKVAMIFDWDNWWSTELSSGPSKDLRYLDTMVKYYKPFFERNIAVDIVPTDGDFDKYDVLVAPLLYMIKPGVDEKINRFVQNGGTFLTTVFSGIVDENDRVTLGGYPGKLSDALGIWVEETDALFPQEHNTILPNGVLPELQASYSCGLLCDVIHPQTAEPLAVYGSDFYSGVPCVTRNRFGQGTAYYIGTEPSDEFLRDFVAALAREKNLDCGFTAPANVEITTRQNEHNKITFVLNYNHSPATIRFDGSYRNLLTDEPAEGELTVGGYDVAVLKAL